MPKFKVWASSTALYTLVVEAEDEDKAWKLAKETEGSSFQRVEYSGDWQVDDIEEVE